MKHILNNNNKQLLDKFNASLDFDKELYSQDIQGSIAHAQMLMLQDIITKDDYDKINNGLLSIKQEIEDGNFEFDIKNEDIHMSIEARLTEIIGDSARKLHTARSRNDQVATDFKLYVKEKNNLLLIKVKKLIEIFVDVASENSQVILPGMTHLQHAQPINFGFHMLAYANMFKRDFSRFENSIASDDFCPLGSAALAGTPHNIDRFKTSELLGFSSPTQNALDSVSNRDFALEILFNISTVMMHISRISEELIIWSTSEFSFVKLDDGYSTTSSIMPQKKNPDVPELLRGKTGRVYGNLLSLFTVMKSLPLAYNKDTQEDKEGVFDSVKTCEISLDILTQVIKTLEVNKKNMEHSCKVGHLTATDLADFLVQNNNMPFRTAYLITKEVVQFANSLKKDLSDLTHEEIKSSHKSLHDIDEKIVSVLNLRNSMNSRNTYGATSTKQTKEQIKLFKEWLK